MGEGELFLFIIRFITVQNPIEEGGTVMKRVTNKIHRPPLQGRRMHSSPLFLFLKTLVDI